MSDEKEQFRFDLLNPDLEFSLNQLVQHLDLVDDESEHLERSLDMFQHVAYQSYGLLNDLPPEMRNLEVLCQYVGAMIMCHYLYKYDCKHGMPLRDCALCVNSSEWVRP